MSVSFPIEQGHCYLADMNPPRKSKPGKLRPVVVIQASDTIAAQTPGIVIVPLSTKTAGGENTLRVLIETNRGLKIDKNSVALLDQIHTLDRALFTAHLGAVSPDTLEKIRGGVRFLLNF